MLYDHKEFIQSLVACLDAVYGEGIDQFVREDDRGCSIIAVTACHGQCATRIPAKADIFGPVVEGSVEVRGFLLCPCTHSLGEVAAACALFHYQEGCRSA